MYKRAQIFAADLWGAFKGKGYGEFNDIGEITIFADYIVPAVLRQLGVLKYSAALAATIEANVEIGSGSEEEVELRACSVCAVEKMRELIQEKSGKQVCLSVLLNNISSLNTGKFSAFDLIACVPSSDSAVLLLWFLVAVNCNDIVLLEISFLQVLY